MPGNYGQQLNPSANGMHIYNPPEADMAMNSGTKTAMDDAYYTQPKVTYAYTPVNHLGPQSQNQNQNMNLFGHGDELQSNVDDYAPVETGGMTRGDRFGTVLFDASAEGDEEPPLDDGFGFDLPNPNLANGVWPLSPSGQAAPNAFVATQAQQQPQQQANMNRSVAGSRSQLRATAVQLGDAIELLASNNDTVRSHAAAYIQHLLYRDEDAKTRCRMLNGIPRLMHVVQTGRLEAARGGLGVLLNISTGRSNDENKRAIVAAGGVDVLLALLATPQDSADVHELVTGIVWNVATCRDVRRTLLERAVQPMVDCVIKPHAERAFQLLQQVRMLSAELRQAGAASTSASASAGGGGAGELAQRTSELRVANQQIWSCVLRNATGALRCISADGEAARRRLRETRVLISSLLVLIRLAIETREFASDRDNKVIENAVCVLRNVSYALQELSDPTYIKRRRDEETLLLATAAGKPPAAAAATAVSTSTSATSNRGTSGDDHGHGHDQDHETVSCFRAGKKTSEASLRHANANAMALALAPPTMSSNDDLAQLWNAETVRLYQAILAECCNPQTIEAAAGALQNLTACEWQPAADIRAQLRKEKALPILVDLLNLNTDSIVLATVLCIRNLVIDQRNKELIGKHALAQLASKLPLDERDVQLDTGAHAHAHAYARLGARYCTVNDLSQATLAAILATIHEVIAMPSKQELAEAERLRKKLEQQAARRARANGQTKTQAQTQAQAQAQMSETAEEEVLGAAIKQSNPAFARTLLDCGCVPRLFFIVRSQAGVGGDAGVAELERARFDAKVLRFAQAVLYQLWLYAELRPEYLRRGWIERDFLPAPSINRTQSVPATGNSHALSLQPAPNSTMNRTWQSTLGQNNVTMRSQPARRAAPISANAPMQQAPTINRMGSQPPLVNGPNTMRSTAMPTAAMNRTSGNTMRSVVPAENGRLQRSFDDVDLNSSYAPDVRVPPAAGRPIGTMPRPGAALANMPRDLARSQGTLAGVPQDGFEPTYTRVDRRTGGGSQPNFDTQSVAQSIGRTLNGPQPQASTLQLVPRRAQQATADEPVADSWV